MSLRVILRPSREGTREENAMTHSPRAAGTMLACLLLPALASAQQLYRCGNTFSQTPCASDAAAVRLPPPGGGQAATAGSGGGQACGSAAMSALSRSDGSTLRVDAIEGGTSEVIQYAQQPMISRKYRVKVVSVAPTGVSLGERSMTCFLSEDGQRVLKLTP